MKKKKFTYEKSGVNINAADNFVKFISNISTKNKGKKKYDNIGGFGVASDNFSYWDQGSDELLAKGNGGTRQMYNYATVDYKTTIDTPKDDWSPDKVGETAMKDMEAERNKDLHRWRSCPACHVHRGP